jgi:S1-C subfamily serine protease
MPKFLFLYETLDRVADQVRRFCRLLLVTCALIGTIPGVAAAPSGRAIPHTSTRQMVQLVDSAVVMVIYVHNKKIATGSGFFITPQLIVTNRHVVEYAGSRPVFVASNALGGLRPTRIVALSGSTKVREQDYAVLELAEPANVSTLRLATAPGRLEDVMAAGFPGFVTRDDPRLFKLLSGDLTQAPDVVITRGVVNAVYHRDTGPRMVLHDAEVSQGNSGGPLLDACGHVVAVNTYLAQDSRSGRRGFYSQAGGDLIGFLKVNSLPFTEVEGHCQ